HEHAPVMGDERVVDQELEPERPEAVERHVEQQGEHERDEQAPIGPEVRGERPHGVGCHPGKHRTDGRSGRPGTSGRSAIMNRVPQDGKPRPFAYPLEREFVEPDWRRLPGYRDVTTQEWESARWQRKHSVRNGAQLATVFGSFL